MHRFVVLGCTHATTSPAEVASARVPRAFLRTIQESLGAQELVYLETCHRTEWYLTYEGELCPGRLVMALARLLPALTHGNACLPPPESCLALRGREAARHLFRVAAALDSLALGEAQVLGQVKEAFRQAVREGLAGPLLHTLFEQSFRVAKRIRTETSLARGSVSLVSLATGHLRKILATDCRGVAILGAGEMAERSAELVRKLSSETEIVIFNRSPKRADELARRVGGVSRPLADFPGQRRFAVVIAATSAADPLITATNAVELAPVAILDLGLPANATPDCGQIPGVQLIDQVSLGATARANHAARRADLERAEAMIEEQLAELSEEVVEHQLSPVARSLVAAFAEASRRELATTGLPEHELDAAVQRLSQRLVRVPLRGLREVASHHSPAVLTTFLQAVKR